MDFLVIVLPLIFIKLNVSKQINIMLKLNCYTDILLSVNEFVSELQIIDFLSYFRGSKKT